MKFIRIYPVAAALVLFASVICAKPDIKLIQFGWGTPSLQELADNIKRFESEAPFDGIALHFGVSSPMSARTKLKYDSLKKDIKLYRSIKFERYKHNFILTLIDQEDPKWLDDDAWKRFAENFAVVAKVANKAGFAGILFDPECYGVYPVNSYWKSSYYVKRDKTHPASKYLSIARQRGQEVGKAMFKEFPDMKFFGLYLFSFGGDLLGEFCNGILDVMPQGDGALIDGDEWNGYCAQNKNRYERMAQNKRNGYGMLDPTHKKKWESQGQLAISFYLDAYARAEQLKLLLPAIDPDKPLRLLKENLEHARNFSDGYIWIYGEKGAWWKTAKSSSVKLWEEQMPGITEILFKSGKKASSAPARSKALGVPTKEGQTGENAKQSFF